MVVWQNGVEHGSIYETKFWNLNSPCGKELSHWNSLLFAECFCRLHSECEHSEMVGVMLQQCQWRHKRQIILWMAMHSCHATKWRVSWSVQLCESVDYGPGTEYGTEYWLQCIGNDSSNTGILCTRWVPWILTQKKKEYNMKVCQVLLNQYKAADDSLVDHIIIGDKMWCHHK